MAVVAGTIGGLQFSVFELGPSGLAYEIMEIRRPGVDLHAFKRLGRQYELTQLFTQMEFASETAAIGALDTYRSMIGSNYAVTRGLGSYGTFKVLAVDAEPSRHLGSGVGGATGGFTEAWDLRCTWALRRVA